MRHVLINKNKIINFHKHWSLLLVLFFIGILVIIVFAIYFFYDFKNTKVLNRYPVLIESYPVFDKNLYFKIEESFNHKAEVEKELMDNSNSNL